MKSVSTGLFPEVLSVPSSAAAGGTGSPCCGASFDWDVPGLIVSGFGQVGFSLSSGKLCWFCARGIYRVLTTPFPLQ